MKRLSISLTAIALACPGTSQASDRGWDRAGGFAHRSAELADLKRGAGSIVAMAGKPLVPPRYVGPDRIFRSAVQVRASDRMAAFDAL